VTPSHALCALFPYTTLFRSVEFVESFAGVEVFPVVAGRRHHVGAGPLAGHDFPHQDAPGIFLGGMESGMLLAPGFPLRGHTGLGDRKSTRLNSSHVAISYAA